MHALLIITRCLIKFIDEFLNLYRNDHKVELEKQNNGPGAWYTARTSPKPNLPQEMTATSANLSHEEFTGKGNIVLCNHV